MNAPRARQAAIRIAMNMLYFSGVHRMVGARHVGDGVIFTMHHVCPGRPGAFQPNRALEITPAFLETSITLLRRMGFEFVSLDEAHRRMTSEGPSSRFACLTFDDGYRDNLVWAYPILKRLGVPFAIFVTANFADGIGHLWWRTLEAAIVENSFVRVEIDGAETAYRCETIREKYGAMRAIGNALSNLNDESKLQRTVSALARHYRIDTEAVCSSFCMDWRELARLAEDPLVTIGAHTVTHPRLRTLEHADARKEMQESIRRIEAQLGLRPAHFAFPYGDAAAAGEREYALAAELGLKTALTTRPGMVRRGDCTTLTRLPRMSLNGEYQRARYVKVLASGAASALRERFERRQAQ